MRAPYIKFRESAHAKIKAFCMIMRFFHKNLPFSPYSRANIHHFYVSMRMDSIGAAA